MTSTEPGQRPRLLSTSEGTTSAAFAPFDWGLLVTVSLVWGASFLFIANGLESFTPATIAMFRVGLGSTTLRLIPKARAVRIDRQDRPRVLLLGAIWMAVPLTLFPIAGQWIDSSMAGMLNGAMPVFVAVVAAVLLQRAPGPRQVVGLAIGFAGIVCIGLPAFGEGSSSALGVALVLLALCCYALSANLSVPLTQKYGALPVQLACQTVAFAYTLPFGLWGLRSAHDIRLSPVLSMLALGVLGTGLAFVLAGTLLARVGATRGAIFTYVMPVVAIALGVVFRDETVAGLALVGTALVLAGAFVTSRAGR